MKDNYKNNYDESISCYLSDFVLSIISFYYSNIVYDKYIIYEGDIQIKNIYYYLFLTNLFLGICSFLGGITHLHFYKTHKIFWRLTIIFTSITNLMLFTLILLLTFKINTNIIKNLNILFCILLFITNIGNDNEIINYFGIISYIIIPIFSILFLKGFKSNKIFYNNSQNKFMISMFLFFSYTFIYIINLRKNCSIPNAFNKKCIFPDWFNHNSMLHLIYSISYILLNKYIIETLN